MQLFYSLYLVLELYMFRTHFTSIIRSTINCNTSHNIVHTAIDFYTGFILSQPMTNTSGCCYSL